MVKPKQPLSLGRGCYERGPGIAMHEIAHSLGKTCFVRFIVIVKLPIEIFPRNHA